MIKYLVAALLICGPAFGQEVIKGTALALDGDTLLVTPDGGGKAVKVRLWGIDAPEMKVWPWGPRARGKLDLLIRVFNSKVTCAPLGKSHKRIVARCRVKSQPIDDIGALMIRSGHAVAYRTFSKGFYLGAEVFAQNNNLGVWAK